MSRVLVPSLTISSRMEVRRQRLLPIAGRVLVSVGQNVTPQTIVAESERLGELHIIRASDSLNLTPSETLKYVVVKEGMTVRQGDVLAEVSSMWGLFSSKVVAPVDGVVEFITSATGHIGLREPSRKIAVNAYMHGVVESVHDKRGVTVTSSAMFIQGIFGVGGEQHGIVHLLDIADDRAVQELDIPEDCGGKILIGGRGPTIDALRCAQARGAVGFVTASIDDRVLSQYLGFDIGIALTGDENLSMTLIITEGFGDIAFNSRIRALLEIANNRAASINGATQVRAGALRPELIVRCDSQSDSADQTMSDSTSVPSGLDVGSTVRMIRVPYFGRYGTVVSLPKELAQLETGAMARVAGVQLDGSSEQVLIPRANMELI